MNLHDVPGAHDDGVVVESKSTNCFPCLKEAMRPCSRVGVDERGFETPGGLCLRYDLYCCRFKIGITAHLWVASGVPLPSDRARVVGPVGRDL